MVTKPKALSIDEFIKTATMFYINDELESTYAKAVEEKAQHLQTDSLGITTSDGLKKYIREDEDSIDNLTSLLNISSEKFKRIVTMLRVQKNHIPTSEWSHSALRQQMLSDEALMDEICELLREGSTLEKYKGLIPAFYLENFKIDATTLGRLASVDDVRRLVKKGLEGKYNNQLGDKFFTHVFTMIADELDRVGLTYAKKKTVSLAKKVMSIAVPDENNPRIMIDITYGITTSSSQTKYAKNAEQIADILREQNNNKPEQQHTIYINILDGAGWVARKADLEKIQRASHFLLNLRSLPQVIEIIKYYMSSEEML